MSHVMELVAALALAATGQVVIFMFFFWLYDS